MKWKEIANVQVTPSVLSVGYQISQSEEKTEKL